MQLTWTLLSEVTRQLGVPLFLADTGRLRANYLRLQDAFRAVYAPTEIAYACKANYLPALCREMTDAGGWVEVSSGMEYGLARRAGVPGDRLVFNGPGKSEAEIARAFSEGAIVNLESPCEVDMVLRAASVDKAQPCRVGLRCNPRRWTGLESRFGFEPGEELASAFSRLDASPNCRVIGLHMHICTRDKSVQTHARLAVGMLEVARQLFPDRRPRYLNVGGGFFSSMEPFLREQFNCEVPDFESYAAAIAGPFAQTLGGGAVTTVLMLEPGLALVADAMSYCTQVTDVRKRNERRLALVAGTVYDIKLTLSQRNLPMQVIPKTSGEPGDEGLWDLTGYTCMEHDVLYRGYTGRLAPGDFVVFRNTGAYTLPLSPSFMRPRPAVVRLGANGGAEVLKRRESAGDALTTYNFP